MLKKNTLQELNNLQIFILSFLIILLFYIFEGVVGIDRFYHPDSKEHYLNTESYLPNFSDLSKDPTKILNSGYYFFARFLSHNYYILIFSNFVFYSITNILIYRNVFKKFLNKSDFTIILLFIIFFLEPYRLHLACHVLKETALIFFFAIFIFSQSKALKFLIYILLEIIRKNFYIYLLIFLDYRLVKQSFLNIIKIIKLNFTSEKKFFYYILLLILLSIATYFYDEIINYLKLIFNKYYYLFRVYFHADMPQRAYDGISNFQNYHYHQGFWLKLLSWPSLYLSGTFILFTSSILFKILGLIIIFNHIAIYKITSNSFLTLGLILFVICISIFSTSYTAMYRYAYIGYYFGIIYFFYKLKK